MKNLNRSDDDNDIRLIYDVATRDIISFLPCFIKMNTPLVRFASYGCHDISHNQHRGVHFRCDIVLKSPRNTHQIFRHLYICMEYGAFIQVEDMLNKCFCQTGSLPVFNGV